MTAFDSYRQREKRNIFIDLRTERLSGSTDSLTPIQEKETGELLSFYNAYLPNHPVHIIWIGEDVIHLRLRIKTVNKTDFPIEGSQQICLRLSNNDLIELKMHQVRGTNDDTLDPFACWNFGYLRKLLRRIPFLPSLILLVVLTTIIVHNPWSIFI